MGGGAGGGLGDVLSNVCFAGREASKRTNAQNGTTRARPKACSRPAPVRLLWPCRPRAVSSSCLCRRPRIAQHTDTWLKPFVQQACSASAPHAYACPSYLVFHFYAEGCNSSSATLQPLRDRCARGLRQTRRKLASVQRRATHARVHMAAGTRRQRQERAKTQAGQRGRTQAGAPSFTPRWLRLTRCPALSLSCPCRVVSLPCPCRVLPPGAPSCRRPSCTLAGCRIRRTS